jgi:cold shock CspA family protein
MRGQMLWFNEDKDRGFIRTDDGERLQVDGSGFAIGERPEGRCADKVVTFEIDEAAGERRALNVVFEPPPEAARRARLGGGGRGGRR